MSQTERDQRPLPRGTWRKPSFYEWLGLVYHLKGGRAGGLLTVFTSAAGLLLVWFCISQRDFMNRLAGQGGGASALVWTLIGGSLIGSLLFLIVGAPLAYLIGARLNAVGKIPVDNTEVEDVPM